MWLMELLWNILIEGSGITSAGAEKSPLGFPFKENISDTEI